MSGKICKTFMEFDDNHKGLTSPDASMYAERAWDYQQTKLDKAIKALEVVCAQYKCDCDDGVFESQELSRQTLKEIRGEE